jgi:hypothetical protein
VRVGQVAVPLGEAVEDLVERHAALDPGERIAQAVVEAVAEGQVRQPLAVDVEAVAVHEPPVVAVRRAHQADDHAALGHGGPVELRIAGDIAADVGRRRLWLQLRRALMIHTIS